MSTLITSMFLVATASAQSELEEVEAETREIQENVAESRSALAALQAKIAGERPGTLVLEAVRSEGRYAVRSVEYLFDGVPMGARTDGTEPIEQRVASGAHSVVARVELGGDGDGYLKSYAFRTQVSASATIPPEGVGGLQLVVVEGKDGRPSLSLNPTIPN